MLKQLQAICHLLEDGEDLVQATIIKHAGSTPRSVGSKMFIRRDGSCIGSIGGGIVEYEMQKLAREIFDTRKARIEDFDLSGEGAATTDQMICGGKLEFLLEFLSSDSESSTAMRRLVTSLQEGGKGYLIKALDTKENTASRMEYCLVRKNKIVLGDLSENETCLSQLTDESAKNKSPVIASLEGKRYFVEPSFLPGVVYIFGAGHVSRPVAELASMVDFRTVVLDDREDFANKERFPKADQIIVIPSYDDLFSGLEIGTDSYLVIVTRGHMHDKTVLEQSLRTPAGYIGMIGSRRKQRLVYDELLENGFSEDDLKRVHNPIGIEIRAETPEEIAVSIVAELIKARAEIGF
ncbi:MAG TPA: XdhC family protein [Geobacteraceae bacterium]|nr:XdhC family protein [Geobacteraceae bacterium]